MTRKRAHRFKVVQPNGSNALANRPGLERCACGVERLTVFPMVPGPSWESTPIGAAMRLYRARHLGWSHWSTLKVHGCSL